MPPHQFCILFLFAVSFSCARAQPVSETSDTTIKLLGVPVLFYTPDTRWGFGGAGVISFRGEPLRSSVTFSVAYTQRKQFLLWFPYNWFEKKGRYRAFGEVGWFRYIFQYFGIGNRYASDYLEKYTAQFPRLRLSALKHLGNRHYAGLKFGMDQYRILETEPGRDLSGGLIPGASGGLSVAAGGQWLFDSRNSPFFPTRGWLVDASVTGEHPSVTGSDFRYVRLSLDAARYFTVGKKVVFAAHAAVDLTQGDPPFFLMPALGGTKKLRGYPDGKFRDRHMALAQAEIRLPVWWRFKAAGFVGAGSVWGTPGEKAHLRPNGGLGLRFELDTRQHIHVRADYGFGQEVSGFYLTVNEAF